MYARCQQAVHWSGQAREWCSPSRAASLRLGSARLTTSRLMRESAATTVRRMLRELMVEHVQQYENSSSAVLSQLFHAVLWLVRQQLAHTRPAQRGWHSPLSLCGHCRYAAVCIQARCAYVQPCDLSSPYMLYIVLCAVLSV